jgi:Uma2 family endonuclease
MVPGSVVPTSRELSAAPHVNVRNYVEMTAPIRLHQYSYLEYRLLEEASSTKHEYLEGEIYAMAGGTPLHAALSAAVCTAFANQLSVSPYRVYSSDLRVRVLATGLATYPDVTVICGPVEVAADDANAAVNPRVIVEVLSEATEAYDRGEKLAHYMRIETLEAVFLVAQRERRIDLWERRDGTWSHSAAVPGALLSAAGSGCSLTVNAIYDAARAA